MLDCLPLFNELLAIRLIPRIKPCRLFLLFFDFEQMLAEN